MLTLRKGTGGAKSAEAMVSYAEEGTAPELTRSVAEDAGPEDAVSYYLRAAYGAGAPRYDMPQAVAEALGVDVTRQVTHDEAVNLLKGLRADGQEIEGKAKYEVAEGRDRITFYDFTWSAGKPASVAYALAPTEAERRVILDCHMQAFHEGMLYLQGIVAHARKGKGGSKGTVEGEMAWFAYTHTSARPVAELVAQEADGSETTIVQSVNTKGDPLLHTHGITPNVVVARDGSIGSLHTAAAHERVHESGAVYQARFATLMRKAGIDVGLHREKVEPFLAAVPDEVCDLFSKRTKGSEQAARKHVAEQGLDWDALSAEERTKALKRAAKAGRQRKEGGERDELAMWKEEALAAGYEHRSVIDPEAKGAPLAPEPERLSAAYEIALDLLDEEFRTRAVLPAAVARTVAARALIATGTEDVKGDVDKLTAAMREHGVLHDGERTPLVWARATNEHGEECIRLTTARAVDLECEAMDLAREAAADKRGALTRDEINDATRRVEERDGLDFGSHLDRRPGTALAVVSGTRTPDPQAEAHALKQDGARHGLKQRRVIEAIGTAGKLAVAVGVAGAGKTTLLRPLVEAWREQGREIYGTALAWRQSDPLADAGVEPANSMALAAFLARAEAGKLRLGPDAVVIMDELSQIGTQQLLSVMRLRDKHGFSLVGIGDPLQNQAIEAGASVALLRTAIGAENVPEIQSSVRQLRLRDRETALLFREGRAEEGLARLREDNTALLIAGGRDEAVVATVDLWEQRRARAAGREDFVLTVSAPTNSDARAISAEIRARRQAAGEIGPDQRTIEAQDQAGAQYDLPLAAGDRVRLFDRVAVRNGSGGRFGNNGSVVTVEDVAADGVTLRNAKGSSTFVPYDTLRDENTGRVRLTYGDAVTLDAIQSATSTEHIHALPSGSAAANSFRNYVGLSRARETSWMVVSDGAERSEVLGRRALGNVEPVTDEQVWENVARNLARQPAKTLATELLQDAHDVSFGQLRSLARAFQPTQQRTVEPGRTAEDQAAQRLAIAAREAQKLLTGPRYADQEARRERRTMRPPAARPKREPPRTTTREVEASFREALGAAGLRFGPKDRLQMDGAKHYLDVDGSKSRRGFYVAYMDGPAPRGVIINHKTGVRVDWKPDGDGPRMNAADMRAERERIEAARKEREALERQQEQRAAQVATARWAKAAPVTSHPYLRKKGVEAHGLREDDRGNLLVPMRDVEGKLWGVQSISQDGERKLYQAGAKRKGTHAILGELKGSTALVIAEGFATAATVREATGLPVAVAFDSGNLAHVARAHRQRDPKRPIVFAADNDHHLPGIEMRQQASAEGRLHVTWPKGAMGKADKGNTVEYRIQGMPEWTLAVRGWHNPELDIGNLVPGARYEVRVYNSKHPRPLANEGIARASAAAKEVDGVVVAPAFAPGDAGTDWNDLAAAQGKAKVSAMLKAELRGRGIEPGSQASRDVARAKASTGEASAANEAARRAQMRPRGPRL